MTLHEVIQDLRKTEDQAEKKIQRAKESAAERIHDAVKQAEVDFDKLKLSLEKKRGKTLKAAETKVKKETEKIVAAGKKDVKELTTIAKARNKEITESVRTILFH